MPARLGSVTSFSQTVYSESDVNITLERVASASLNTQRAVAYTTVVKLTRLVLKVFDSDVAADGFIVVVSFYISFKEEFGEYVLVVENNIMPAARRILEIVPQGKSSYNTHYNHIDYLRLNNLLNAKLNRVINITKYVQQSKVCISDVPSPPVIIEIHNIGPYSVTISWSEGFHGGSDQTVYYEIRTDNTDWAVSPMETIETSDTSYIRNTTINNLIERTTYYIRLYSKNSRGKSNITVVSKFTTGSVRCFCPVH